MSERSTLFDAACMLGRWEKGLEAAPTSADALAGTLARLGIGEALVYHATAAYSNVQLGNERLMAEIAGLPQLHPCWVLLGRDTDEVPPPDEQVGAMLALSVRAGLLLPRSHRVALRTWNLGGLLERLAAHRLPLMIEFGQGHYSQFSPDWDGLYEVGRAFPTLPLILHTDGASTRMLFRLLELLPNLHIEMSYFTVHRGLELVARTFGAERVLFATGIPYRAPGPVITALAYADLSEAERALIGGDNLRRLLGGVLI